MRASPTVRAAALAVALALLPVACTREGGPGGASVLLQANRAFAEDVAAGGSEAWASWFAGDGALIRQGVGEIRGREAVRKASSFLDQPGTSLRWEPVRAELAESGELGWTTGRYTLETADSAGRARRSEGIYVTIWRRQLDGSWKVAMDIGNPTATPDAATGPGP